jgi:transcriptional regulator with XRE-family HTH domain
MAWFECVHTSGLSATVSSQMAPKQDVRLALRRARERLRFDQAQFAEALGQQLGRPIPRTQISDWERGRHEPGATVLIAAAELAGTSIDELLAGSGGPLTQRLDRLDNAVQDLKEEVGRLNALAEWVRQLSGEGSKGQPASSDRIDDLEERVAQIAAELGVQGPRKHSKSDVDRRTGQEPTSRERGGTP